MVCERSRKDAAHVVVQAAVFKRLVSGFVMRHNKYACNDLVPNVGRHVVCCRHPSRAKVVYPEGPPPGLKPYPPSEFYATYAKKNQKSLEPLNSSRRQKQNIYSERSAGAHAHGAQDGIAARKPAIRFTLC